jgi:hypothetical protein
MRTGAGCAVPHEEEQAAIAEELTVKTVVLVTLAAVPQRLSAVTDEPRMQKPGSVEATLWAEEVVTVHTPDAHATEVIAAGVAMEANAGRQKRKTRDRHFHLLLYILSAP